MEIREYAEYNETEIARLYTEVGWTALMQAILDRYKDVRQIELATDNAPQAAAFYKAIGFCEFSELGCRGFMRC